MKIADLILWIICAYRNFQRDHPVPKKHRQLLQASKKKDCPAKIIMKDVVLFPEYKVCPTYVSWWLNF